MSIKPFIGLILLDFIGTESLSQAQPDEESTNQNQNLKDRLSQLDKNKDGKISRDEARNRIRNYFDRIDTGKDGFIDLQELKRAASQLNRQKNRPVNNQQAMSTERLLKLAPEGVIVEPDLAYRKGESQSWRLDLVRPDQDGDAPRPAIVFIHGGGWRSGDKRRGYFINGAMEYAQRGYVCISVNYRLTGEAPFPACIEDVKCAVRWLRANARKYNIDPRRVGGYGNSAGAHLVAMLGLTGPDAGLEGDGPYRDQSSSLQAVCCSAAPTNICQPKRERIKAERSRPSPMSTTRLRRFWSCTARPTARSPSSTVTHSSKHSRTLVLNMSSTFASTEPATKCSTSTQRRLTLRC